MLENDCESLLLGNLIMVLLPLSCGHEQQLAWDSEGDRGLDKPWKGPGKDITGVWNHKGHKSVSWFTFNSRVLRTGLFGKEKKKKPTRRCIWNVYYEQMCINSFTNRKRKGYYRTSPIYSMGHTLIFFMLRIYTTSTRRTKLVPNPFYFKHMNQWES